MADYQFNTQLGPQVQQTNLGDILKLASGVQAYQQAQQLNPIALEKAKLELEQQKFMNPLERKIKEEGVTQAQTTTKKGQLGLSQDQSKIINSEIGSVINDPRLVDANPLKRALPLVEAKQRAINGGVDPVMAEIMFAPIMDKAFRDKDPNAVSDMLNNIKNIQQSGLGAEGQVGIQKGSIVKIGNVDYKYNALTGKLEQLGATPSEEKPKTKGEELFREDMPITPGTVMQLNERQDARYKEGEKLQAFSNSQLDASNQMTQSIRKIRETINSASGSLTGQALRDALRAAVGSAEYETLSKNLEDLYVRNTEAMGGNTDAARESIRRISGSPNLTREALEGIIDRVEASSQALKKFNQGLNNYAKKTSTENAYIHARQFQQAWNANADPLVFMAQSINASNKSKAEKQLMQQKLLKDLSDDQIAELKKKAKNIKLLESGNRIVEND